MRFVQYYLACLSQASYLIGDETTGRAVVVDPRRDVQEYVVDAAAFDLRIEYVVETHLHADFLSGHLELADATGGTVTYGAAAEGICAGGVKAAAGARNAVATARHAPIEARGSRSARCRFKIIGPTA